MLILIFKILNKKNIINYRLLKAECLYIFNLTYFIKSDNI